MPATDEEHQAAKDDLGRAVARYWSLIEPGVYAGEWALVAHVQSPELEQANMARVCVTVPTGQSFPLTRGMLDVALEQHREVHYQSGGA